MNRPTRVLVIDTAPGTWGAQACLLRLAEPLARRGYELVLAAPPELDLAGAWRERGLPFVPAALPLARSVRTEPDGTGRLSLRPLAREAAALSRTVGEIGRLARASGAAAIHGNGHPVHLDVALAGRRARVPTVLHLHEEMAPAFGRALRTTAILAASGAIAVSRSIAEALPRAVRGRVSVVPNGVDLRRFAPGTADPAVRAALGAAPADVLLVAATRLDPVKRIEDLVRAVAPLRDRPGWHLAVVGATSSFGAYAARVEREARATLGPRVSFPGRRDDMAAVLRAADVLVHAGVVEGMPLGVVEAQAAGRPVVAYRVAGVPDAVRDGRTALLAEPGDAGELGRLIEGLVQDEVRRQRMGDAARRHAERELDLERQADRHAAVLDRVVGAGSLRPLSGRAAVGRPS